MQTHQHTSNFEVVLLTVVRMRKQKRQMSLSLLSKRVMRVSFFGADHFSTTTSSINPTPTRDASLALPSHDILEGFLRFPRRLQISFTPFYSLHSFSLTETSLTLFYDSSCLLSQFIFFSLLLLNTWLYSVYTKMLQFLRICIIVEQ